VGLRRKRAPVGVVYGKVKLKRKGVRLKFIAQHGKPEHLNMSSCGRDVGF
jgi:hypothetical protein